SYQGHREWLNEFERFQTSFKSIAKNYQSDLEEKLEQLVDFLKKERKDLSVTPLHPEVIKEIELFDKKLQNLEGYVSESEEVFHKIKKSHELKEQLNKLKQKVKEQEDKWNKEIQALSAKNEALSKLNTELLESSDFDLALKAQANRIQKLREMVLQNNKIAWEEARQKIAAIEQEHEQLEKNIKKRCEQLLEEYSLKFETIRQVLDIANGNLSFDDLPLISDDDSLEDIVQVVRKGKKLQQDVHDKLDKGIENYKKNSQDLLEEIKSINNAAMSPDVHDEIEYLVEELKDVLAVSSDDKIKYFQFLLDAVNKTDDFLKNLKHEEYEVKEKAKLLSDRLRAFKFGDGYYRYIRVRFTGEYGKLALFDLVSRVEAMITGVKERPGAPSVMLKQQLEQAERLFNRIENQAIRLAAQEVDESIKKLKRKMDSSSDRGFLAKGRDLLEKVGNCHEEERLPSRMRSTIEKLSK
ncbi:MAG TPA: hypothetical protein VJL89_11380, partial [Thermodesulfovibrionia bacterium]|nr:hypothetical protein [Thermodesulfovibrionia bacterium]